LADVVHDIADLTVSGLRRLHREGDDQSKEVGVALERVDGIGDDQSEVLDRCSGPPVIVGHVGEEPLDTAFHHGQEDAVLGAVVVVDGAQRHAGFLHDSVDRRRLEIDDAITTEVGEFDSAVRDAAQAGRTWWNDTKTSMRRPLDEVRARVENRKSEHELHRALRAADAAEEDAAAAIEVADYFLDVAEYAIIDAALARMAADELALEPAPTVGAPS